ncbi:MAG: queuosine salvage family protein [Patescibacteria group bacterium]|nr:queuosine salvage family protein [Patescibacteria group bacterium]
MSNKVGVIIQQCELIAESLRPLRFRAEHYNRPFLAFKSDDETKLRAYLFSSAICHQTHTLINRKKNLKGWGCLEDVYTQLGETNSPLLDPEYITGRTVEELKDELKPLFSEDGKPENCTLDRLDERSEFIIDISKILKNKYDGKVTNLIIKSDGLLLNKGTGIYELLEEFQAFKDPLKKKSTVFLQLAANAGLLKIKDLESLEPVMDYHMQRILLRMGCIQALDENLKSALINRETLTTDVDVRCAAVEAVRLMGKLAQKDFFEMDEMLWSLARSCCHEKPLCEFGTCAKNPCTFFTFMELDEHNHCIFADICRGAKNESYRKYWQPIVETNYY